MYFSTKSKTSILLAAIVVAAGTLIQVSAYTGGKISIKLNNTQFTRLTDTGNYQIKVFVDYSVTDPALIGQKINAVMKVYSSDGSLLKTTSFPGGFPVNRTGGTYLLTSIPISPGPKYYNGNCIHRCEQDKSVVKSRQDNTSYDGSYKILRDYTNTYRLMSTSNLRCLTSCSEMT
jgi:hypothetical protein